MPKNNPPNQSLNNRLMQRIKDLPRPDERYAKWEIRAELDDIHQLIQDELIQELESLYESPYLKLVVDGSQGRKKQVLPRSIIKKRISALREGKE